MSGPIVFHFTDSLRLPWILAAGELRPSVTTFGGEYSAPLRYVWGTTNPEGDLTAGPLRRIHKEHGWEDEWQAGAFLLVRFTLPANAFLSFSEMIREFSDWTPEQAVALIEYDRRVFGETGHDKWRCRHDPLRLRDVLKVETTSYAQVGAYLFEGARSEWQPLDISRPERLLIRSRKANRLGVRIGGRRFHSDRFEYADRRGSYYCEPWPEPAVTKAKRAAEVLARRVAKYEARRDLAMQRRREWIEEYEEEEGWRVAGSGFAVRTIGPGAPTNPVRRAQKSGSAGS